MKHLLSYRKGFTIVELIVVIVIIGILASIGIVAYNGVQRDARDKSLLSDIDTVDSQISSYALRSGGKYDSTLNWNSEEGSNSAINTSPASGNVIVVNAFGDAYCIRAYNPSANAKTLEEALKKGTCGWRDVNVGSQNVCGVNADGKVYCWGKNNAGQLGTGLLTPSQAPQPVLVSQDGVLAGKTMKKVAVGSDFVCAVATDGIVACWGYNALGQLGIGTTTDSAVPVLVDKSTNLAGRGVTTITAAANSVCTIAGDGAGYCWGSGTSGQLGAGSSTSRTTPYPVYKLSTLANKTLKVINSSSSTGSCTIASDDQGYCWGLNTSGQLGTGTTTSTSYPTAIARDGDLAGLSLIDISAGTTHSCAIASDNAAYCWGSNASGQLGNGTTVNSTTPTAVLKTGALAGKKLVNISTGTSFTCALSSEGEVFCWGSNGSGQIGIGSTAQQTSPVKVLTSGALSGKKVTTLSTGTSTACTIASDQEMYCWGRGTMGEIGDNANTSRTSPTKVRRPDF